MPTARMMDDGEFAFTVETKRPDDRISINFQALPWLEVTGRYAITYGYFAPGVGGRAKPYQEYDRSLGFKLGLTSEGRWRPKIAVGVSDIGGTLLYSGEYFVASKRFGRFDTSLGVGWGRFGSLGNISNPFGQISKSFDRRPHSKGTGQVQFNQFFHGPAAIFGGVVYNTPIRGLQLEMEYSGDSYPSSETGYTPYKPKSQFNYGISYRPFPFLELGAAWMYGRSLALRVSLRSNLKYMETTKLDPRPLPFEVRSASQIARADLINRLNDAKASSKTVAAAPKPSRPRVPWQGPSANVNLSNAPDWTVYPVMRGKGGKPAERTHKQPKPAPVADNVGAIRIVKTQLARLQLPISRVEIEGDHILFLIDPSMRAVPLDCDSLWPQLSTERFVGTNALTIASARDGGELFRCTKFITPRNAPPASAIAAAGTTAAVPTSAAEADSQGPETAEGLVDATKKILAQQELVLDAIEITGSQAKVYYGNPTYQKSGEGLGRAARAMTHVLPPNIEVITLIQRTHSINGVSVSFPRSALERVATVGASSQELLADAAVTAAKPGLPKSADYRRIRLFHFSPIFAPGYRQSLFDPDNPLRFQVRWKFGGTLDLTSGLSLQGLYGLNLYNNFNTITRTSNSVLPHVRSDFAKYLKDGASGIDYLQLVGIRQFSPSWTGRLSVGYLEQMYGGVSGELLYHPMDARWALGLSLAQVWKRDYNELFGFQHYNVATGHLSLYYETPFKNIDLTIHAGRYLAKDWGGTIQLSRRFNNGAEVGAFATFTNVPFKDFGEGSFDKGIFVRVPLDFFSVVSTRQTLSMLFKPLTRDGGAMLDDGPKLWPIVRSVSYGATYRTWNDVRGE